MNAEKLAKLQQQVRIGGKGSARRKKKVVHRSSATDDKKLQNSLKKLTVNNISGIEEVNMIKDDGSVIHFNNPKVQASLNANTFAVSGHAESKQITEMLPGILNHLGAEGFNQLKRLASSVNAGNVASGGIDEDDDDVPELVEDFESASKAEKEVNKPSEQNHEPIVDGKDELDDVPDLIEVDAVSPPEGESTSPTAKGDEKSIAAEKGDEKLPSKKDGKVSVPPKKGNEDTTATESKDKSIKDKKSNASPISSDDVAKEVAAPLPSPTDEASAAKKAAPNAGPVKDDASLCLQAKQTNVAQAVGKDATQALAAKELGGTSSPVKTAASSPAVTEETVPVLKTSPPPSLAKELAPGSSLIKESSVAPASKPDKEAAPGTTPPKDIQSSPKEAVSAPNPTPAKKPASTLVPTQVPVPAQTPPGNYKQGSLTPGQVLEKPAPPPQAPSETAGKTFVPCASQASGKAATPEVVMEKPVVSEDKEGKSKAKIKDLSEDTPKIVEVTQKPGKDAEE